MFRNIVICGMLLAPGASAATSGANPAVVSDTFEKSNDQLVKQSQGVIIRVPINEKGEEDTSAAEMRLHVGNGIIQETEKIAAAWNECPTIADGEVRRRDDPSFADDGATADDEADYEDDGHGSYHRHGWRPWRHGDGGYRYRYPYYRDHYYHHHYRPYYYRDYRPSYYGWSGAWRYLNPIFYTLGNSIGGHDYYGYPYAGYRYYYYPRAWGW